MRSFPPAKIRNVVLVGHGGSGKTSLAEALLFCSGAVTRQGRVEDGTTTTDFDPEAVKRKISVSLGVAPFEWRGHKINLIDTPGYADFVGEVRAALAVADLAVFVVSAVEGVEVQTRVAWRMAADAGLPRMIFVNKLDRERASYDRTLDQLREVFGAGVAPLELPIGEEAGFRGVADLLTDAAITYEDGAPTEGPLPDDLAGAEHEVHDALVEGIVVADDGLMERYLEGDVPSIEELEHTMARGVAEATVFPVVCGSATRRVAVDRLANFICEIGPSPADRPGTEVTAGPEKQVVPYDPSAATLAFVFKTLADPYVGKVSILKVLSGTIHPDDVLVNSRTRADERLHGIFALRGKEHLEVSEVPAGDLVAVAKLSGTRTGDTLAVRNMPATVQGFELPAPVLATAIRPRSKGDDDKLMTALHRLQDEDMSLAVHRDDATHQTVLSGMGETHLAIVVERLGRKFGVEVDQEPVRVPYRETITATAEAEGKYKKQTGGHGQFGVAFIRIEPSERGAGFSFVDQIVGGAIPRQFIPAVEKGIAETMSQGGHYGFPVVDLVVTCFDGKYHPVDSSEMSFKMAGSLALKEALAKASPVILEPISALEVIVPMESQGDVMGDLNSRRGRVQGTDSLDGEQVIQALVPTAELSRYAVDLRSITGGAGRFSVTHDHYEPLPHHLYDKVLAEIGERQKVGV
ncbi:MAG TPA: elongation factor G [Acidimicrobiales bacterium]|nr:elongation factor G [Acidimicrobiales bacterium]